MEYGASDLCLVKGLVALVKHSSQLSAESLIWLEEVEERKAPRRSSQHHSSNHIFSQMHEKVEF
jgi:hypothetical protein